MAISIASSSNPTLSEERFSQYRAASFPGQAMTLQGAVNKTAILLVISFLSAGYVWKTFFAAPTENTGMVTSLMIVGAIAGFVVAMVTVFKNSWSPITAPLYALLQGLLLGGISALTETQIPRDSNSGGRTHICRMCGHVGRVFLWINKGYRKISTWSNCCDRRDSDLLFGLHGLGFFWSSSSANF